MLLPAAKMICGTVLQLLFQKIRAVTQLPQVLVWVGVAAVPDPAHCLADHVGVRSERWLCLFRSS